MYQARVNWFSLGERKKKQIDPKPTSMFIYLSAAITGINYLDVRCMICTGSLSFSDVRLTALSNWHDGNSFSKIKLMVLLWNSTMIRCSLPWHPFLDIGLYNFLLCFLLVLAFYNWFGNSSLQLQALVGFEKSLKHLDEHLVDIGSKVSVMYYSLACLTWLLLLL